MSEVRDTILKALWEQFSEVPKLGESEEESLETVRGLSDAAEFMGTSLRELMKKYDSNEEMEELVNEAEGYDFSQGERGKYAKRLDPAAEKTIGDLCLCSKCPIPCSRA